MIARAGGTRRDISTAFDTEAFQTVEQAWRIAKNWRHATVEPIHLLAALVATPTAATVFTRLGGAWEQLTQAIKRQLTKVPPEGNEPRLSTAVSQVLFGAYEQAYAAQQATVLVPELLAALVEQENRVSDLLTDLEMPPQVVQNVVVWLQVNERLRQAWQSRRLLGRLRPNSDVNKAYTAIETRVLDRFSVDMTRQAVYGYFLPHVGRHKELQELFRVIEGSNTGVIIVGQPGVGKTALLEELAQRMMADDVPRPLQDKRLVAVSIPKLIAGASAAEANARLLAIFDEVAISGNIVLVFENLHALVGISSGGEDSLDLSEAVSTYITRQQALVIGTTTPEYYRTLESDSNITTVLRRLDLPEPEMNAAIQMAETHVGVIENKNQVYFSYAAVAAAVEFSLEYLHDGYLPAQAISILEETGAHVRNLRGSQQVVGREDVAAVVSDKTNIPLTNITEEETEKLVNLEAEMHARVIGQDEAVADVASALRRGRAGMRNQNRPIASFLFLGPTGVGKTELAKTIAAVYFGNADMMIRTDMSEFQTQDSIARLIGAPGDKRGGVLTEAVRRRPFSLLLFDEIEKAHPEILNLFLQVMDDGRLTDSGGRTVDFSNSIIVMTSNAATRVIQQQVRAGADVEAIRRQLLNDELPQRFRPEFLNRFDAINIFKPLTPDEVAQIAGLMIRQVATQLEETDGVVLQVTAEAQQEMAQLGYDPEYGARPLRRVIQERLQDALANLKITKQYRRGDTIVVEAGGQTTVIAKER